MCECGCGEGMHPQWTFAGPEGFTYGLAFYTGCRDCDNPPGILLYRIPNAEIEDDGAFPPEFMKPLRFVPTFEWEEVAIGVAWPEDMKAALREAGVDEYAETDDVLFEVASTAKRRFVEDQNTVNTPDDHHASEGER